MGIQQSKLERPLFPSDPREWEEAGVPLSTQDSDFGDWKYPCRMAAPQNKDSLERLMNCLGVKYHRALKQAQGLSLKHIGKNARGRSPLSPAEQ